MDIKGSVYQDMCVIMVSCCQPVGHVLLWSSHDSFVGKLMKMNYFYFIILSVIYAVLLNGCYFIYVNILSSLLHVLGKDEHTTD